MNFMSGWNLKQGLTSLLLLLLPICVFSSDIGNLVALPNNTQLQTILRSGLKEPWSKDERIEIRSIHRVVVDKSEDAFLVSVWLPDRGRNFVSGAFLYRPAMKQAKQLDFSHVVSIPYSSFLFEKFAVLEDYGSGSGLQEFTHALVRFSGWKVEVLRKLEFGDNLGACETTSLSGREPCKQTRAAFLLLDNPENNSVILMEYLTTSVGSKASSLQVSTTVRRLHWVTDRFIPVFETK